MKPITAAEPLVEALLGLDLPVAWTPGTGPPQINAAWLQARLPMPLSARQDAEQLVIAGAEVETRVDGCMLATDTGALLLALPASEERRAWFLHEVRNLAWAVACGVRELAEANPMDASLVLSDLAFATTHLEHLCHAEMGSRSIGHTTLAGAATAVVRMARRSCDIPIELSCAVDAFAAVQMHPADFTRALLNLILNAAEALRGAASPILPIQVRVGRQEPDGLHRIQVLDRGPGLAGKAAEDLFDRGVSGSAKGTGIGLFEVRSIARLAGGDATLQQRAGGGAIAELRLPGAILKRRPADASAGERRADTRLHPSQQTRCVLIGAEGTDNADVVDWSSTGLRLRRHSDSPPPTRAEAILHRGSDPRPVTVELELVRIAAPADACYRFADPERWIGPLCIVGRWLDTDRAQPQA